LFWVDPPPFWLIMTVLFFKIWTRPPIPPSKAKLPSSPKGAAQSNSSSREGEGAKCRLLDLTHSKPCPYLWAGQVFWSQKLQTKFRTNTFPIDDQEHMHYLWHFPSDYLQSLIREYRWKKLKHKIYLSF
jgi:hypothetical protein